MSQKGFGDGGYRGNQRRRGGSRGSFRNFNTGDAGNNSQIPPVPRIHVDDPYFMPYKHLRATISNRGDMTRDEELLRAITIFMSGQRKIDFYVLFDTMESEHHELMALLYHSADHLQAYMQCYPEHFTFECDPCRPDDVQYLMTSKVTAKSDYNRYRRDLADGKIQLPLNEESMWDGENYDVNFERRAAALVLAVFHQGKIADSTTSSVIEEAIRFVSDDFSDIFDYMDRDPGRFLRFRLNFFVVFGATVTLQSEAYCQTVRVLSEFLKGNGRRCSIQCLYEFYRSSPLISEQGKIAIGGNRGMISTYDDFTNFINKHKLLFRLRPRQRTVELRHDVMPPVTMKDVEIVPPFPELEAIMASAADEQATAMASSLSHNPCCWLENQYEDDDDEDDSLYGDDDILMIGRVTKKKSGAGMAGDSQGAGPSSGRSVNVTHIDSSTDQFAATSSGISGQYSQGTRPTIINRFNFCARPPRPLGYCRIMKIE